MNYVCPHCSSDFDIDEKHAGTQIECPSCEKEFVFTVDPSPVGVSASPIIQPRADNLMFCSDCGDQFSRRAAACPKCGAPNESANPNATGSQPVINIQVNAANPQGGYAFPRKSRLVYILLALFLGLFGIHNFYAGYVGTGLIQLLLSLTVFGSILVAIWVLFDILLTSKDGRGVPFA